MPTIRNDWENCEAPDSSPPPPSRPDQDWRATVVSADALRGAVQQNADLWCGVRSGDWIVADSFSTDERGYLVLRHQVGGSAPLRPRDGAVLERMLLGESQKAIAIDFKLAPSTIAAISKSTLRAIGVTARASCVPPLLCMLARSAFVESTAPFRETEFAYRDCFYRVLSMELKSSALAERLSPAEETVARMRIEGRSLAEIALSRHTSRRTVANQLATASKRLGVSGRSSLVHFFLSPPPGALRARYYSDAAHG
jgi:DNA-binding CsgD family transcriptional regulator